MGAWQKNWCHKTRLDHRETTNPTNIPDFQIRVIFPDRGSISLRVFLAYFGFPKLSTLQEPDTVTSTAVEKPASYALPTKLRKTK